MNETLALRKEGILCRKLGEEWILYDPEMGTIHFVNAMAEFVWRLCDGCHSIDDMEQKVTELYDVPDGTDVRGDVRKLIESFAELGMLAGRGD